MKARLRCVCPTGHADRTPEVLPPFCSIALILLVASYAKYAKKQSQNFTIAFTADFNYKQTYGIQTPFPSTQQLSGV